MYSDADLLSPNVSYVLMGREGLIPRKPQHELLTNVVTGCGVIRGASFLYAKIEKCRLLSGMFAQFGHLVHTAHNGLLLFSLIPALCLVPLSLLPRVFLLALCES